MKDLITQIFSIDSAEKFNSVALEVFKIQSSNSPVYREFLENLEINPSIINNIKDPLYYPPLQSRNKTINNCKAQIQPIVKKWNKFKDQDFYQAYLDILKDVADDFGNDTSHHDIEMLLFAYAEELALSAAQH